MEFMNLDRNALVKISNATDALTDIINLDLDPVCKDALICSLACILLERVNKDTRQRLFEEFESLKEGVDAECGELK